MIIHKSPYPDVALRDVTITQRLFEALDTDPTRVVLRDGAAGGAADGAGGGAGAGLTLTGAELKERVQRLAAGIIARGFGAGQVIAVFAPNMPDYATVFHAIAFAGGTVTTLNPSYTEAELRHQLRDAGATLLVTVPGLLAVAALATKDLCALRQVITIGAASGYAQIDDWMDLPPLAQQIPVDAINHCAVLPYSSGTTGLPKGVMLSHRNLVVNVDQAIAALEVQSGETSVGFLPFFHIYGMNVVMNTFLCAGACVVTMPRYDLHGLLGHVQSYKTRLLLIAPPVAIALSKDPAVDHYDLSSLKVVLSAAAPLGAEIASLAAQRLGAIVVQGYGLTELSPLSHVVPFATPKPGAVGVSAPNTEVRIVDPGSGLDQHTGLEGEVWVRGPQVMMGYFNNPDATARMLQDNWLRTGDLGLVDSDGYLFIRDRLKELIKVKGFQVAPAEVEAALLSLAEVADAAVIGVPDDDAGETVLAFVVAALGMAQNPAAIQAALRLQLASYKVPTEIVYVDAIPKSASGKILRRVLRDQRSVQS